MATFIDGVNRVLRNNTIIAHDDDDLTTFTDTQHKSSSYLARQAIQDTITELSADKLLPLEEATDTITLLESIRVYSLASDFVRFQGEAPFFLELDGSGNSANRVIHPYPGGRDRLRREVLDYKSVEGTPNYFYHPTSSTKQVAFYQIPNSSYNNVQLSYDYEKSVYPTSEADTLPFVNDQESHAFLSMASRRFQFLFAKQPIDDLEKDALYRAAKASLLNLTKDCYPNTRYGYDYV